MSDTARAASSPAAASRKSAHVPVFLGLILMVLCAVILVRTAWIADDALITLRSALNFIHGYGPTFNVDERVQAYTHPAWFLLVSGLLVVSHNPFLVVWLLSFVCAILVCHLVQVGLARGPWQGAVGVLILLTSKSYVDFMASGLENPLAHALIGAYALVAIRIFTAPKSPGLTALVALGSTIYLTRPDLLLLVAPIGVAVAWRQRADTKRLTSAIVIGALPAIAWTGFSLWYYGFPFPNTAYAKLGTGLSAWDRVSHGVTYLADSISRDPLTLPAIGAGVLLGIRSAGFDRALAVGVVGYLAYVVWIGGDFMAGRFLTAPLLAAVIVIVRAPFSRPGFAAVAFAAGLLALPAAHATILSGSDYSERTLTETGIADERGFYYQNTGLLAGGWNAVFHGSASNPRTWSERQRRVTIMCGRLGTTAIEAGPSVHVIDPCGLADPLLSRLPPRQDIELRIGHYARLLPAGYLESVSDRANRLEDPDLRDFYELIRRITRGPLTSGSRIADIIRINLWWTGWSEPSTRVHARFWSPPRAVPIATVSAIVEHGAWDAPGHVVFDRSVDFTLPSPGPVRVVDVSVDGNDSYRIDAIVTGRIVAITSIGPTVARGLQGSGVVRHVYELPLGIDGVSAIRVTALGGDGKYSVGHLVVR